MSTLAYSSCTVTGSGAYLPARELSNGDIIMYLGTMYFVYEVSRYGDKQMNITALDNCTGRRTSIFLSRNENVKVLS